MREIIDAHSCCRRRETLPFQRIPPAARQKEIHTLANALHDPVTAGPPDGTGDRRDRSGPWARSERRWPRRAASAAWSLPEGSRPGRPRGTADPSPTTGRLRIGPLERSKTAQAVPVRGGWQIGPRMRSVGCHRVPQGLRCSEVAKSRAERRRRTVFTSNRRVGLRRSALRLRGRSKRDRNGGEGRNAQERTDRRFSRTGCHQRHRALSHARRRAGGGAPSRKPRGSVLSRFCATATASSSSAADTTAAANALSASSSSRAARGSMPRRARQGNALEDGARVRQRNGGGEVAAWVPGLRPRMTKWREQRVPGRHPHGPVMTAPSQRLPRRAQTCRSRRARVGRRDKGRACASPGFRADETAAKRPFLRPTGR